LDTILQTSQGWQQLSAAEGSGQEEASDCLLEPGDSIGLFISLLLAIPSPLSSTSSPSSSSSSNYDTLLGRLQSALMIAEFSVFPNIRAVSTTLEADLKAVAFIENNDDKKEILEKLEKRRHKASGSSKGLIESMMLITSQEGQNGGGAANLKNACKSGINVPTSSLLSLISVLRIWTIRMLKNSNKVSIEKNRIKSNETPFTLNMVKKEKNLDPPLNAEKTDIGSIGDLQNDVVLEELVSEPLSTRIIDSDRENEEDEIEVGGHSGNIEELKRLIKALQAILEGFSTSKVD
jgi:hypothetical protein